MDNLKEKIEKSKKVFWYLRRNIVRREETCIVVGDDFIYKGDNSGENIKENSIITDKFWKYINLYLGIIIELSEKEKKMSHYKSSTQEEMIFKINENKYTLSLKVADEKTNVFYRKLLKELLKIT